MEQSQESACQQACREYWEAQIADTAATEAES